jgi:ABC-2 type transport system permease protein
MSTHSTTVPESALDPGGAAPPMTTASRPLYWSVRREIWENRSVYLAPLAVAALVFLFSLISVIGLPRRIQNLPAQDPAQRHASVVRPFSMAPAPIMLATFVVGILYCVDALYGERRDRSILFWKSLPVSDLTTVVSKASIPLVVLPAIAFVLSLATQVALLILSTAVLLASNVGPATLWGEFRFLQEPVIMIYGLTVHALWFAPIYAWLLLVSAWARRTPVLWAALPPIAISMVEKVVLGTSHFASFLGYRVAGAMREAFAAAPERADGGIVDGLSQLDPVRFLTAPGLWIGLIAAAVFLAAAARLRRQREPI